MVRTHTRPLKDRKTQRSRAEVGLVAAKITYHVAILLFGEVILALEHRVTIRHPLNRPILLNRRFNYSKVAEIENLSVEGAFVRMNPADLTPDMSVDMVIALRAEKGDEMHRLPAQVVRVTHEGVGLKFLQYGDRTYTALINFLCLRPSAN